MTVKRIAIDVDEVLTPMLRHMVKWRNPRLPLRRNFRYEFRNIWNVTEQQSQKMLREFYETEEFKNLPMMDRSLEAMKIMKDSGSKLYVMTGRQDCVREKTEDWIEKNYPGIFTDVILTNSYTPSEVSKADMCELLSINALVDDNLRNCVQCYDRGINGVNYIGEPTYPWCYPNALALKSWKQFCDISNGNSENF
jgi:5'(3')-deoxyribonucleotidase